MLTPMLTPTPTVVPAAVASAAATAAATLAFTTSLLLPHQHYSRPSYSEFWSLSSVPVLVLQAHYDASWYPRIASSAAA